MCAGRKVQLARQGGGHGHCRGHALRLWGRSANRVLTHGLLSVTLQMLPGPRSSSSTGEDTSLCMPRVRTRRPALAAGWNRKGQGRVSPCFSEAAGEGAVLQGRAWLWGRLFSFAR